MTSPIPPCLSIPPRVTVSMRVTNLTITKAGRRLLGLRIEPRKAKGYRRHVRAMKAAEGRP